MEASIQNNEFAIKSMMLFQSYYKNSNNESSMQEKNATDLVEMLEKTLVNCALPQKYLLNKEITE